MFMAGGLSLRLLTVLEGSKSKGDLLETHAMTTIDQRAVKNAFWSSIKCWEILEYLSDWRLLKKGSAPWSSFISCLIM
jgi:hypothetical protein